MKSAIRPTKRRVRTLVLIVQPVRSKSQIAAKRNDAIVVVAIHVDGVVMFSGISERTLEVENQKVVEHIASHGLTTTRHSALPCMVSYEPIIVKSRCRVANLGPLRIG